MAAVEKIIARMRDEPKTSVSRISKKSAKPILAPHVKAAPAIGSSRHPGPVIRASTSRTPTASPEEALRGIRQLVSDTLDDLCSNHDPVPQPLAERQYSGEFRVRIPPELHRQLAILPTCA